MGDESYLSRIVDAGQAMGLSIDNLQAEAMQTYVGQLHKWNRTYNLTAIRQPGQMLVQHVFDSLSILPSLDKILYKKTVSVMDIGAGAGLPGLILAIMRPSWQVTCVDAVEKKIAFIRQMAGVLALPNLHATHGRVESLESGNADLVISRAFAALADFAGLAGRHVRPQGWLVAMKGHQPSEEATALEQLTDWRIDHVQALHVPELDAQRCLVWMSRKG